MSSTQCKFHLIARIFTNLFVSNSGYLPHGVRLSAYASGVDHLPESVLQEYLDAVAAGTAVVPVDEVFQFEQLKEAHDKMGNSLATGKLVVLTGM